MNRTPTVTVLIPTYNYAHYLDETIGSVLAQTYTDFELVIMDNCSTDNTREVVGKYLGDRRVRYIVNEKNLGLVGNWNKCLDYGNSPYIKMLCADDKLYPPMLEQCVAALDAHPSAAIVTSKTRLFGNIELDRKHAYAGLIKGLQARETLLKEGARNWLYCPSATMFRRSSTQQAGRFNPDLLNMTDKEYYVRLLSVGDVYVIPEYLSAMRAHDETQSAQIKRLKHDSSFEAYKYFKAVQVSSPNLHAPLSREINNIVKRRAANVARLVYKTLPRIYDKDQRVLFKRAWSIGVREGVLLHPLLQLVKSRAKPRT